MDSVDESSLVEGLSSIRPPEPPPISEVITVAQTRVSHRQRLRTRFAAAASVLGVAALLAGITLGTSRFKEQPASSAGPATTVSAVTPFDSWHARGALVSDPETVAITSRAVSRYAGSAKATMIYAGPMYGDQGLVAVARWETPGGWKAAFLMTSMHGLRAAATATSADLTVRAVLTIPRNAAGDLAYVGFVAPQKAVDGTVESLAFAVAAPGVQASKFHASMMEDPDSDATGPDPHLAPGVAVAVLSSVASPWNTYLATSAGTYGLLTGGTQPQQQPALLQDYTSAASSGVAEVEIPTGTSVRQGDVVATAAGIVGTVTKIDEGIATVNEDAVVAANRLDLYSHISGYHGTLKQLPANDARGGFARFVPTQSATPQGVNRVLGRPKSSPNVVVGIGQVIPGSANILRRLPDPGDLPLYLIPVR
jgi:hypothetical protein